MQTNAKKTRQKILTDTNSKPIKNKYVGVMGLRAFMCNPNADFDSYPRVIGGRHCMSPMSIKYPIKDYWNNKGILVRRVKGGDTDEKKSVKDYIDIITFGTVGDKNFAEKEKGFSIKGAVQITDAISLVDSNTEIQKISVSDGRIGDRAIVDEGHYFTTFYINKFATKSSIIKIEGNSETRIEKIDYTEYDFENLIEGAILGASNVNGYSKTGLDNEFLLLIKLKEDSNFYINQFHHLIEIEKTEKFKININLNEVFKHLYELSHHIEEIKIYYNDLFIDNIIYPKKLMKSELLTFAKYLEGVK